MIAPGTKITRILRLAALSPELMDSILRGDHPSSLTVHQLTTRVPFQWDQQMLKLIPADAMTFSSVQPAVLPGSRSVGDYSI